MWDQGPLRALLAVAVVGLSACGAPAPGASTGPSASATASSAPPASGGPSGTQGGGGQLQGTRCHTGQLGLAAIGRAGAGAGNVYQELGLTNRGGSPCSLSGYVGMALLDAAGRQLPTHVVRDTGSRFPWARPGLVTLPPGATSPFWIHWEDVPTGSETSCPTSVGLALTPPDETTQLHVDLQAVACDGGTLDVSPMTPPGTTMP